MDYLHYTAIAGSDFIIFYFFCILQSVIKISKDNSCPFNNCDTLLVYLSLVTLKACTLKCVFKDAWFEY